MDLRIVVAVVPRLRSLSSEAEFILNSQDVIT
jgi:hypothetical protein